MIDYYDQNGDLVEFVGDGILNPMISLNIPQKEKVSLISRKATNQEMAYLVARTCPCCGSLLVSQSCKLRCSNTEKCGYFMSCSEF